MRPGSQLFKLMVRHGDYKYIYVANGGREQLFDLKNDKNELVNLAGERPELIKKYRKYAEDYCARDGLRAALDGDGRLKAFDFYQRPYARIRQFDESGGVKDFIIK